MIDFKDPNAPKVINIPTFENLFIVSWTYITVLCLLYIAGAVFTNDFLQ